MSERIVLPKLVYKGCDNPAAYLSNAPKGKCISAGNPPVSYEELEIILEKQEQYELPRPEPMRWLSPFWEEHKRLVLERKRVSDICEKNISQYRSMSLSCMIQNMSGVHTHGFYTEADILNAEHILGVKFADDYKECLYTFGHLDLYRLYLCNLFDEGGVIDGTLSYREWFPSLRKKYYFVFGTECENMYDVAYFQDVTGYIYAMTRNGEFEPIYSSWKEALMGLWQESMEGTL